MATQYTAGLTTGQVLTAATMNSSGAAWENWAPTITASSGTITSGSTTSARYMQIQKLVIGRLQYSVTTAGTAAGAFLIFTLPITGSTSLTSLDTSIGFGREYRTTGSALNCIFKSTTTGMILTYNNGGVITNNYDISVNFIYEAP